MMITYADAKAAGPSVVETETLALPDEVTVTLSKANLLLILQLTTSVGLHHPQHENAKAVFRNLIRAARVANGLEVA